MAVIELRAGDRALARAVFLSAVPGPGWRWGSLGVGRGKASWNALGGILVTAGRFFPGLLQPFIQLPLGRRGVISLKKAQEKRDTNINHKLDKYKCNLFLKIKYFQQNLLKVSKVIVQKKVPFHNYI